MRFLLDTNVCIAVIRGNDRVRQRLETTQPDDCGVSMVSVFELLSGVERCRRPASERRKVEAFLAPLHLLPFDYDSAARAAELRWQLEREGRSIGPYDLQLAGQALALELVLVTSNVGEFARVQDLKWENWQ